jgi:hypothetical protein
MTDAGFLILLNNIELDTTLTAHHQRKSLKVLKEFKLIEVKRSGNAC